MKKILHLIPELNYGGSESVVISLCKHQIENGESCKIVLFGENNRTDLTCTLPIIKVKVPNIALSWSNIVKHRTNEFTELVSNEKPDVIHSHSYWTNIIALNYKMSNIKYVFHIHRFLQSRDNRRGLLTRLSENILLTFLLIRYSRSEIIVVSNELKRNLFIKFPLLAIRRGIVHVVGNPIDSLIDSNCLKNDHDFEKSPLKIISVSRLENEKNIFLIPELALKIKELCSDFSWDIYGEGTLSKQLEEKIRKMDSSNEVRLMGTTSNLSSVYANYDIYVSVSKKETFGLSILEALSQGVLVIGRVNGGSNDFLIHMENSIYLDSDDPSDFANAIYSLFKMKNKNQFIKNGYILSQKYTIDQIAKQINNIYNK